MKGGESINSNYNRDIHPLSCSLFYKLSSLHVTGFVPCPSSTNTLISAPSDGMLLALETLTHTSTLASASLTEPASVTNVAVLVNSIESTVTVIWLAPIQFYI